MMRVRIVAPGGYRDRYGITHQTGDVVEYTDHIALKLLRGGIAVAVREAPIERAVRTPPETTATQPPKPAEPESVKPSDKKASKPRRTRKGSQ